MSQAWAQADLKLARGSVQVRAPTAESEAMPLRYAAELIGVIARRRSAGDYIEAAASGTEVNRNPFRSGSDAEYYRSAIVSVGSNLLYRVILHLRA
jgi:hypothetical protein